MYTTSASMRTAILLVAAHIESSPEEYDFDSVIVPRTPHCGSPACVLGWLHAFSGVRQRDPEHANFIDAPTLFGISDSIFYERMDDLQHEDPITAGDWRDSAQGCAHVLRLYADHYHPLRS